MFLREEESLKTESGKDPVDSVMPQHTDLSKLCTILIFKGNVFYIFTWTGVIRQNLRHSLYIWYLSQAWSNGEHQRNRSKIKISIMQVTSIISSPCLSVSFSVFVSFSFSLSVSVYVCLFICLPVCLSFFLVWILFLPSNLYLRVFES